MRVSAHGGGPSTEMPSPRTILIAGTASHVGKSTVTTGLCHLFATAGVSVAPFKAQNMSNEARVVLRSPALEDPPFGEIGVAQTIQAEAAGLTPTTDMNPVLLKPQGAGHSRLIIDGIATDAVAAGAYYTDQWHTARDHALAAYDRLAADAEVIVAEGAGSIAEMNLQHRDLANIEVARHADAEIILVADIERGGVFAQVVGTVALMPEDLREQLTGIIITKFRGDPALFAEGRSMLEAEVGVDILGVIPHTAIPLPDEDSLSYPGMETELRGDVDAPETVEIAVPRLPRAANTADLDPLRRTPGVVLRFLPPDGRLGTPDAVVLTGTKNTVDDMQELEAGGLAAQLRQYDGPLLGICGGYQLLGEQLTDPGYESPIGARSVRGLGRLPVETHFAAPKRVTPVTCQYTGDTILGTTDATVTGYAIHRGRTRATEPIATPFTDGVTDPITLGAAVNGVCGTYLHGLFENAAVRSGFLSQLFDHAGVDRPKRASGPTTTDGIAVASRLLAETAVPQLLGIDDSIRR